jgi:hypothetical protein
MDIEITLALPSYRALILLGEYDMSDPDANTQIIGLKAASPEAAASLALKVTGRPVLEIWRQDNTFRRQLPAMTGFDCDDKPEEFFAWTGNVLPIEIDRQRGAIAA